MAGEEQQSFSAREHKKPGQLQSGPNHAAPDLLSTGMHDTWALNFHGVWAKSNKSAVLWEMCTHHTAAQLQETPQSWEPSASTSKNTCRKHLMKPESSFQVTVMPQSDCTKMKATNHTLALTASPTPMKLVSGSQTQCRATKLRAASQHHTHIEMPSNRVKRCTDCHLTNQSLGGHVVDCKVCRPHGDVVSDHFSVRLLCSTINTIVDA